MTASFPGSVKSFGADRVDGDYIPASDMNDVRAEIVAVETQLLGGNNSFTPSIIGTTAAGVGTYTTQVGKYWEVGELVFVQIELNWTAHTGTGNMRVAGLPFAALNTGARSLLAISWNNITLLAVGNKIYGEIVAGTDYVSLFEIGSGSASNLPIDTAGILRLSGFYPKA